MESQPDILLIMPDQMRADCLGIAGNPSIITPNIDAIGGQGCHFQAAYSTCPSCCPSRKTLLTGQHPARNGSVGARTYGYHTSTLPALLGEGGYHSVLVGRRMDQNPSTGENPGYETCVLGSTFLENDSYAEMLEREVPLLGGIRGLGLDFNGWQAKSWPLAEHLHPTNWTVRQARRAVAAAAADRPLFLTTSFYAPHPPLAPPDFYYQRYLNLDLPDRSLGDWVGEVPENRSVHSHRVDLKGDKLRMTRAAYYGLINHMDDQLTWLIQEFQSKSRSRKRPFVIVFTSDHGEMLGDHRYFRKCEPFEGACKIPLLVCSEGLGQKESASHGHPVCLEDIMPTLLEFAGIPVPEAIDGVSLVPVLRDGGDPVREWLHCEHSPFGESEGFQMLTDGVWKYVWRPITGEELLFNLRNDPRESINLAPLDLGREYLGFCRGRLVDILRSRPEGFVEDGKLRALGRPWSPVLPDRDWVMSEEERCHLDKELRR